MFVWTVEMEMDAGGHANVHQPFDIESMVVMYLYLSCLDSTLHRETQVLHQTNCREKTPYYCIVKSLDDGLALIVRLSFSCTKLMLRS
jgi:hypothetical protein